MSAAGGTVGPAAIVAGVLLALLVLCASPAVLAEAAPADEAQPEETRPKEISTLSESSAAPLPDAAAVLPRRERDPDPWIGMNRSLWAFNNVLDRNILRPIALGYRAILPDIVEEGVSNFFDNLQVPGTALNQLLQGKPKETVSDVGRFAVNSTVGVLGFFDVSTRLGLPQHEEDFGQTLAVWGVPQGPFFMIPIRGPSTVTQAGGMFVDAMTNPIRYIRNVRVRNVIYGVYFLDLRKRLLTAEVLVSGDEYLFIRDAFLQRRDFLIRDGVFEEDPFLDFDDFEDF
ncbi:MAG: VacJ family lipoprotein [Pseudomonadota bacterium]